MSNPAQSFCDADYKQSSSLEALDKLLQCDAVEYAGMDLVALKALQGQAIIQVNAIGDALVRLQEKQAEICDAPLPLDAEKE